jgi:hypothetical protein
VGLGSSHYVSSFSLVSTVVGLGNTYISSFDGIPGISTVNIDTYGIRATDILTSNLTAPIINATEIVVDNIRTNGLAAITLAINTGGTLPTPPFIVDINGPTQSATYYSSVVGNIPSFTPSGFGVFYDFEDTITVPTTIITLLGKQSSDTGKYNVFRNNTGRPFTITVTLNGVTRLSGVLLNGNTGTVQVANNQGVTFMVAGESKYALF